MDTSTKPAASAPGLAPLNLPRRTPRPVSCYALFKGWLLLSQPPGCLRSPTAFPTKPGLGDLSRRSGLFPSRHRSLSPDVRLPGLSPSRGPAAAFGVGRGLVGCSPPTPIRGSTSAAESPDATPTRVSGRTSYLRARLAFHRYPHLIPRFCNTDGFGPPCPVKGTSPWAGVARSVSGLPPATERPIQTRFPYGSAPDGA